MSQHSPLTRECNHSSARGRVRASELIFVCLQSAERRRSLQTGKDKYTHKHTDTHTIVLQDLLTRALNVWAQGGRTRERRTRAALLLFECSQVCTLAKMTRSASRCGQDVHRSRHCASGGDGGAARAGGAGWTHKSHSAHTLLTRLMEAWAGWIDWKNIRTSSHRAEAR
jgi:hypothetical protein